MLEELRPAGLVGIGILPGRMRRPFGVDHALAAPERLPGTDDRHPAVATWPTRPCARSAHVPSDFPSRRLPGFAGLDGIELQVAAIENGRLDADGLAS